MFNINKTSTSPSVQRSADVKPVKIKSVFIESTTLGSMQTSIVRLYTRFSGSPSDIRGVWIAFKSKQSIDFHYLVDGYSLDEQLKLEYSITESSCRFNISSGARIITLDLDFKDLDTDVFNSIQTALNEYDIDTLHENLEKIFYEKYLVQLECEAQRTQLEQERRAQECERIKAQPFSIRRD